MKKSEYNQLIVDLLLEVKGLKQEVGKHSKNAKELLGKLLVERSENAKLANDIIELRIIIAENERLKKHLDSATADVLGLTEKVVNKNYTIQDLERTNQGLVDEINEIKWEKVSKNELGAAKDRILLLEQLNKVNRNHHQPTMSGT